MFKIHSKGYRIELGWNPTCQDKLTFLYAFEVTFSVLSNSCLLFGLLFSFFHLKDWLELVRLRSCRMAKKRGFVRSWFYFSKSALRVSVLGYLANCSYHVLQLLRKKDTCRMHDKTKNTSQNTIVLFLFSSETIECNNVKPLASVKVYPLELNNFLQNFHLSAK